MHSEAPVLSVRALTKSFALYAKPVDRLIEALTGRKKHQVHRALEDISFDLYPGQALGVIGQNGAGKSTLLKLIAGVLDPDAGQVSAAGRITGLLELGTGFDQEATGRENIGINGHLLGLSQQEIDAMAPAVIEFAELGPFIDTPLRAYSSGMQMRLGFAIAFHAKPKAFVVDEALSVGDARFQQRCMQQIREYKRAGGALLFVSHDLNAVRLLCDQAMVLHQGRQLFQGAPEEAVRVYYKTLPAADAQGDLALHGTDADRSSYGAGQVMIDSILWRHHGREQQIHSAANSSDIPISATSGDRIQVVLNLSSAIDFSATVGLLIRDRFGQDIFGVNTALLEIPVDLRAGGKTALACDLVLDLGPGSYTLTAAVHADVSHVHDCQHWWDNALEFEVTGFSNKPFSGLCRLDHHIAVLPG